MKKNKKEQKDIGKIDTNLQISSSKYSLVYWLAFAGLWGLVFLPPYFQGLFFSTAQNIALIFAVIFFSVWWVSKVREDGVDLFNNPMDWFVAGLLVSYIIAFIGAASQRLAIEAIVQHLLYFNVFWLASRLIIDYKSNVMLINVIIFSTVGVAIAGLLAAMEWIYLLDGFVDNRIFSTLQYPNTLASYILAVSILALGLWQNSSKNFRYGYILLTYIMMVVFFGTNSRGAFLLLPIMLVLTLANPWLKNKIETLLFWIITSAVSLVVATRFIANVSGDNIGLALLWVFLGIGVVAAGQFLLEKIQEKEFIKPSWPQGKILLVTLLLLIVIFIPLWQTILPEHIVARFATASLQEVSTGARVYYAIEAFNRAGENPLFGLGGGAWEASYRSFQGFYYISSQVHNDFAQALMEVGAVGLTFLVGLWVVMFYLGFKNLKVADDKLRNVQWAVMVAALTLGGHALLDFVFAFSAVSIVLFVLFGITVGIYRQCYPYKTWFKEAKAAIPIFAVSAVFIIMQLILPISLNTAQNNAARGVEAAHVGNIDSAIHYLERARTFNPFNAHYRIDLAKLYVLTGEFEKAEEYILAASVMDRYNSAIHRAATEIYFELLGDMTRSVESMEMARDSNRWNQTMWNDLAQIYYFASILLMEVGEFEEAQVYLERLVQIPAEITTRMDALGDWERALWVRQPLLIVSPQIYLYSGIGHYFFDNLEVAEYHFNRALAGGYMESLWWLAMLRDRQGHFEAMDEFYERAVAVSPEFESNFWGIMTIQNSWWNRD